ncbi:MAG: tRNA pseudouridine(55) synthase TruB [Hormoscilla sp. GUM202]|nr:tRNA pseudouridine(55) synthase TruB [Hormoscilla sp. GUM202]
MTGFLNLNKPAGLTSHDCVARVRRLLRLKRVGHAGTLDPAATGVLPIALSKATRLLQFLPQDKAYHATIRLGVTTTTDDTQGEVISSQAADHVTLDTVRSALKQFEGKIQQVPPNYSAIQVQGKRLYNMARSGEKIQVQARSVEVYNIDVLAWRPGDFPELDLAIACGPGTYIRAIARDLGAALLVGGTLAALDRTHSSGFSLADSLTFDEFESQLQQQIFTPISPDIALAHLKAIELPADKARRWCQGQRLTVNHAAEINNLSDADGDRIVRVKHADGRILGIGKLGNEENNILLIPQVVIQ